MTLGDDQVAKLKDKVRELEKQLAEALRMAEHPAHQLFELQPWLGVEVEEEPTDGKGLKVLKLRMQDAANDGEHDSGAGAAGIEVGDHIKSIKGVELTCSMDLDEAVEDLTAGDKLILEVTSGKDGKRRRVAVQLGAEDVPINEVTELRTTVGVESDVWERPSTWERMFKMFLHPSSAEHIEQLEAALQALEDELADAKALLTKQLMNDRQLDKACKELLAEELLELVEDDPQSVAARKKGSLKPGSEAVQMWTPLPLAVVDESGSEVGSGSLGSQDAQKIAELVGQSDEVQKQLEGARLVRDDPDARTY